MSLHQEEYEESYNFPDELKETDEESIKRGHFRKLLEKRLERKRFIKESGLLDDEFDWDDF